MNLGIDFGTTYTKLAYWENGQLIYLHDNHKIPSVATYVPAWMSFFSVLRQFTRPMQRVSAHCFSNSSQAQSRIQSGQVHPWAICYYTFSFSAKRIPAASEIISRLYQPVVPNNFGLRARRALLVAAQNAFAVDNIALVPEPLAAIIGYNAAHPDNEARGDLLLSTWRRNYRF
jgi:hypothetical protein